MSNNQYHSRRRGQRSSNYNSSFRKPFQRRKVNRSSKPQKKQIDLALYDYKVKTTSKESKPSFEGSFADFDLNPRLSKIIEKIGYKTPTEIQAKVIPQILQGKDVVGVSQTGSGKTAAYLIPILNQYLNGYSTSHKPKPQTLIIVPTRELAYQIEKELFRLNLKVFNLYSLICIGGTDIRRQIRMAKKSNHFIIGTPGRLVDLCKRKVLDLSKVNTLVVDEMDKMLDMGFVDDITWLIDQLPENKQSCFFSATTDKKVQPILEKFAPKVAFTTVNHPKPSEFVEQRAVVLKRHEKKLDILSNILSNQEGKTIVFVSTKSETERVAKKLSEIGLSVDYIHGDRSQSSRTRVLKKYRSSQKGVLVATDVAARGLDIDDVLQIINYDEPQSVEDYIHRVGRTGRAGKFGKAVTLVQRGS
jgi:superfamily II DNA/RNA helicase